VILYGIYGGGHTWPGSPFDAPFELGLTSMDINATETIWAFFEAHSGNG
jgi:polyhydroxybutyrate depolymerase